MKTIQTLKQATMRVAALVAAIAAPSAFAASQTWSNAPTSALWVTGANWIGNAAPGGINLTGNTINNDVATFNSPISGGFGGAGNPVLIDDATLVNTRSRQIGGFRFSGDAGAYVISTLSAPQFPAAALPGTGILYLSHNNNITVDASVTNAQQLLAPMLIRLPSSTDGRYFITNNATSPEATVYIANVTNSSAATRQLILVLNGSNTGTNTIAQIGENASGALRVVKTGTGRWILSGANQWSQQTDGIPASMFLEQGTLVVKDPGVFGALSSGNISVSNGVLQIDGITLTSLGLTLRNGGTVQMNGTAALNSLIVANQAGNSSTLATTSASDVFTVGAVGLNSGGLADSTLTTAGPGTIIYNIGSTYIGKHVFSGATNVIQLAGALGTGPNLHVSAGAIADITPQGAASYTLDTAALSASGTGTVIGSTAAAITADAGGTFDIGAKPVALTFTPTGFSGDTTHPSLYIAQGTLALGGNTFTVNNASGTPLGAGTYRIVEQASGSITSGGSYSAIVTGAGLAVNGVASIQVSGGNIDLVVVVYIPKNLSWKGGNPDATWDLNTTANFDNAGAFSVYNNPDVLTFGALGSANPAVTLVGALAPGSVVVDTAANDYSFAGSGQIAGSGSLTKNNAGTLTLGNANTYQGGTTVNGGTVRIGANEAIPSSGPGNVAVQSPAVIDLNNFNNTVNGLSGTGTVDNQGGAASMITVGNNNATSTFSGTLANTSGTLGLTKAGSGQLTLTSANSHSGSTIINAGTVEVQNANSLGSGAVTVNGGNLRTTTSLNINSLTGANGTSVANAAGAATTIITHTGTGNYTGAITDGASGTVGIYIPSGTLQLNSFNNAYSGGTIVASGATLGIGVISPGGSGNAGTGGITASNTAVVSLATALGVSAAPGNNITNADAGGTITLHSASQGNTFGGQFIGAANSTNIFVGPGSIGGNMSFANFPGTVVISNGSSWRFFTGTGVDAGGDNTTFILEGSLFHRDVRTARLGALMGSNGSIAQPSNPNNPTSTFMIGAKNIATTFSGTVGGSNNIVKVGAADLTFNGVTYSTNVVTLPDPFEPTNIVSFALFTNRVTYTGNTVVSNGTLRIIAPNNLTNSSSITLAGGTLDATMIGYSTNQTTLDYFAVEQVTNTFVVTSGVVEILAGKSLNGQGSLLGSVTTDAASTMNVGNPVGTMAISGSIALNGTVNMGLNRTNSPNNSDRITAASFSGSGATLNVADVGPALFSGTVFQLFNTGVTAFSTINLPATSPGGIAYTWQNDIATLGSITLVTGLNPNPTNVTATVTGGGTTLTLDWPASHVGWTLQSQTNAINVGITGTWSNVAGSAATNQVVVPINPGNPTVFYRLTLAL